MKSLAASSEALLLPGLPLKHQPLGLPAGSEGSHVTTAPFNAAAGLPVAARVPSSYLCR